MNSNTPDSRRELWIIDDDETALILAQGILSGTEFNIRTFCNAPLALEALKTHFPDLIVVDVIMPGMSGFDFCEQIRSQPEGAAIPLLIATSLDDTESIHRAYLAGATGFAIKPIHWTVELYHIRYMLRGADIARELREKESETRMAKEDWERTFNAISDVVTVLDKYLRIIRANAAASKLLGLPLESIVGRHCHELFYRSSPAEANCPTTYTLKTGLPMTAEIVCNPKGAIYEVSTSAVTDQNGNLSHLVHVARDLSQQKLLEAEYRQAQKMEAIGTLAGGIAHDFNNLLTVILGCGETLKDEEAESGRCHDELSVIVDAAKRGAALSRQLMTFSRKEACKSKVQTLDLNQVIQDVWKMLEKITPRTIKICSTLSPNLRRISADSGQLEQVLINLTVNAVHAMTTGGSITIQTENTDLSEDYCRFHPKLKPGKHVMLTLTDTGCGMSKQTQERIYEPFFTTKKLGHGTGLGLSVVFGILRDHNGQIICTSEENVGTTFKLYFPEAQQSIVPVSPALENKQTYQTGTQSILIVDDEAPIRNLLQRFLLKLGYTISVACDGETALKLYEDPKGRPQLVILDLGMPNMNGWECLERLMTIDPEVNVIIATGYGGDDLEDRVYAMGAKDFINKPYDLKEMSKKIHKILNVEQKERLANH